MGWDSRGIPTKETLKKLGLADVDPHMKKLRK
jgi:aldehyde:ferredoxin oxidoreductase